MPILHNYYELRDIRKKFKEEKAFLEKRNGIKLSFDHVTCLIGERYLTDNVINYLMNISAEEGNTLSGKNTCLAVDSILLCCSERIIG